MSPLKVIVTSFAPVTVPEIVYSLYVEYINQLNNSLYERKKEHRASYQPLSDFLKYNHNKKDVFYKKAKTIIRKDKIEKIWKKN